MRAARIERTGGPEVIDITEVPSPTPSEDEVVVEVAAAGVNFIDTYQRSGAYPLPLPSGLGLEGAGTVVAVGAAVSDRQVGDPVAWSSALGSYAEQVAVSAERTVRVPAGVDASTAAALMLQGMTAHYLANSTHALNRDDVALVYAAAGGVGRLLVQLASRRGARVIACTSTDDKAEVARSLGADDVILYRDVDLVEAVAELTDGQGVDVVYDSVGADTFDASLSALKPRGLMVLYGQASGPVPPLELQELSRRGSLYVTRPTLASYTATQSELEWRAGALFDLVRSGQLDVHVHGHYPLEQAARAHTDLASGSTAGKLLLEP